jgi:hypothetical protein
MRHLGKMNFEGFGENGADAEARIEGVVGVLKNHLNLFSVGAEFGTSEGTDGLALVGNGAGGGINEADDGAAESGLPRTAFADESESATLFDFERNIVECFDHAGLTLEESRFDGKVNGEIGDLKEGRHGFWEGFYWVARVARSMEARRFVFWPRRGMQSRRARV